MDIIPYGKGLLRGDKLVWPESGREMNMAGFDLVFDLAEEENIGEGINIPVPPVPVAVFCKILTFLDRRFPRDLADAAYMLAHYEEVSVSERRFESHIPEDLPYEMRGAFLAGSDLGRVITSANLSLLSPLHERLQEPAEAIVDAAAKESRIKLAELLGLLEAFGAGLGLPPGYPTGTSP